MLVISQMPVGISVSSYTRWVVLPNHPPAGSGNQANSRLFPLGLLHLSCPAATASADTAGSAVESSTRSRPPVDDGVATLINWDGTGASSVPVAGAVNTTDRVESQMADTVVIARTSIMDSGCRRADGSAFTRPQGCTWQRYRPKNLCPRVIQLERRDIDRRVPIGSGLPGQSVLHLLSCGWPRIGQGLDG